MDKGVFILNSHYFNHNLTSLLGLDHSRIITLVGGGGKTSLMNTLGKEFAEQGIPTLLTTTTHIMKPDFLPDKAYIEEENLNKLTQAFTTSQLQQEYPPLAALGIPEKTIHNKIKWKSPSIDFCKKITDFTLQNQKTPLRILCEGDGSKRLPAKLPKDGEPVFFPKTDTVIGVIGLSCLGKPIEEVLFRYELLNKIFSADSTYNKQEKLFSFNNVKNDKENSKENTRTNKVEKNFCSPKTNNFLQYRFTETSTITTEFLYWLCLSEKGLRKNVTTQNFYIVLNQADLLNDESLKSVIALQNKIKNNGIPCFITSLKNGLII